MQAKQATRVTLKLRSAPSATVGGLKLTLLDLIDVAAPAGQGLERFHRARLHLESGGQGRDLFLTGEASAFGYTLKLHSAGDGQASPQTPRESIVEIDVTAP